MVLDINEDLIIPNMIDVDNLHINSGKFFNSKKWNIVFHIFLESDHIQTESIEADYSNITLAEVSIYFF